MDKPEGPTSHDVVAAVRRRVRPARTGHTGTLDPMATGVLPVCVGPATRLARFLSRGPKVYTGEMVLGVATDTYDRQGRVTERIPVPAITRERLDEAAAALTGDLLQQPPPWSAKKIDGRRSYDLAREGRPQAPRPCAVRVERFEIRRLDATRASFLVECSGGTYVRSLAHDLGRALGCGAHLTALRRTRSGPFSLEQALPLDRIRGQDGTEAVASALIPLEELDLGMATARLTGDGARAALNGRLIPSGEARLEEPAGAGSPLRLLTPGGALLGVGEAAPGGIQPRVILAGGPSGQP